MSGKDHILTMARYNLWQNESLTEAADGLSEEDRRRDRGAFFGSIQGTFSHILFGDHAWMSRFTDAPAPECGIAESVDFFSDWAAFQTERKRFDAVILEWAHDVNEDWFTGDLSWFSGAMGREVTKPKAMLSTHMFNHQTHHRGQIHAMLTAAGARPEDTDIPFMPEHYMRA